MKYKSISITIVLFSFLHFIYAADVKGKVVDSGSGDFLPGANVMLDGTNYGASSDDLVIIKYLVCLKVIIH